jgi:hypothetical protein
VTRAPVESRLLIFGDSTANSLGWALRALNDPTISIELRGLDGCSMLLDTCDGDEWPALQRRARPKATLVVLGGAFLYGRRMDGRWRTACYPEWDRTFESTLIRRLRAAAADRAPVWLVTAPYPLGPYDSAKYREGVDCINAAIRRAAAAVTGVRLLDLGAMLCPAGSCVRESDGVPIRPDGVHFDVLASRSLARRVLEQVLH